MKAHPRREFLLSVLAACGTPFVAPVPASAGRESQTEARPDPDPQPATIYFGAGIEAARTIGEAYLRHLQVEATRASIREHTAGALQILAKARNQKAALTELVSAVRRDFQEGRVVQLEGWIVSRTEAELCALTLLPATAKAANFLRDAIGLTVIATAAILTSTCDSPTKPGPVVDQLAIHSVAPTAGPAAGGTEVTIRGAAFAAGTTVTIGGRAATDVNVRSSDMLTARTPASVISGSVDVMVTSSGRTTVLTGGFRYDPIAPNTSPVIVSIAAQGRRLRQPPAYADYGETIAVTLVIQDAESTPAQLTYQWQACGGSFNGNGPQVEWTASPIGTLPSRCTIQVTVTDGPHVVGTSIEVRLHNSVVEVGALALEFLTEFANNLIPAATTVRNFSNSCPGKAAEQADVEDVRRDYTINTYTYGTATVNVAFGGMCKTKTADACVITPVEWRSTYKPTGRLDVVVGVSTISGIYRDSRWWLCDSLFDGPSTLGFWPLH